MNTEELIAENQSLHAQLAEAKQREKVALASWDEERQRAEREGQRVTALEHQNAELESQLDATDPGVHSCGDTCQRPMCIMRRENAELHWEVEKLRNLIAVNAAIETEFADGTMKKAIAAICALRQQLAEAEKDKARLEGEVERLVNAPFVERPESKNPTLWRYLQNAFEKHIAFHSIGVNRIADGGFHFYIHPQTVSGDTEDYLIWPDPFSWEDMLVNRKDSTPPDVEKFKAYLAKHAVRTSDRGAQE